MPPESNDPRDAGFFMSAVIADALRPWQPCNKPEFLSDWVTGGVPDIGKNPEITKDSQAEAW